MEKNEYVRNDLVIKQTNKQTIYGYLIFNELVI